MSALDKMSMPEEIVEAIQVSLPEGQVIRHVGLMFRTNWDVNGNPVVWNEEFMAVTDSIVAFRRMRLNVDLNAQKFSEKNASESEQQFSTNQKGKLSWFKRGLTELAADNHLGPWAKTLAEKDVEKEYIYYVHLDLLTKKYGPIGHKWLPETTFSSDTLISEITLNSYQENRPHGSVASIFKFAGHQVDNVGDLSFSVNGSAMCVSSFFEDIRKIYDHIQSIKLGKLSPSDNVSRVTKCLNCGSTELTAQGAHIVCDYCQSKFSG